MSSEKDLREQLALCTRIFAMQGMDTLQRLALEEFQEWCQKD